MSTGEGFSVIGAPFAVTFTVKLPVVDFWPSDTCAGLPDFAAWANEAAHWVTTMRLLTGLQ